MRLGGESPWRGCVPPGCQGAASLSLLLHLWLGLAPDLAVFDVTQVRLRSPGLPQQSRSVDPRVINYLSLTVRPWMKKAQVPVPCSSLGMAPLLLAVSAPKSDATRADRAVH